MHLEFMCLCKSLVVHSLSFCVEQQFPDQFLSGAIYQMTNNVRMGRACLFLVLCYCCAIQSSSQLFRFCHRGVWHQLLENDCPYGLLFLQQLQTPCFYTIMSRVQQANTTVPRIWQSLCDDPRWGVVENATKKATYQREGSILAQKNGKVRMVDYALLDGSSTGSNKLLRSENLISLQSCEDLCYRDLFEESPKFSRAYTTSSSHEVQVSDSLEAPYKAVKPKLSKDEIVAVTHQTLALADYLFETLIAPEENPGPKLRLMDLFKRSMKILGKSCPHPFISSNFVNRVMYGFLFLVTDSGTGELEDIPVEEFEEIMVALNACDEKSPDFRLEGTACETSAAVTEVIKILENGTEYVAPLELAQPSKQKKADGSFGEFQDDPEYDVPSANIPENQQQHGSFPYGELDIFIEAAWSAVQVTHATCFATFKPNANMHHRYVAAMEQLFNEKIQDRWRNPTRLIDDRMWATWILADVDQTFRNLQVCLHASYLDAPFVMRLDRPIDPVRQFKSRKRRGTTREPYWESYQRNGGMRYKLKNEVKCFQSRDERDADAAFLLLKEQCQRGS